MPPKVSPPETENGFRVDDGFLNRNLFMNYPAPSGERGKGKTFLNVNYLPHFQQSIKRCFPAEDRVALKDHDLQTFLIEISMSEVHYTNAVALRDMMISHINSSPQFWLAGSAHQNRAKTQQAADQLFHDRFLEWKKDHPNKKIEDFERIYAAILQDNPPPTTPSQSGDATAIEEKNRIDSAMCMYKQFVGDASKVKKRFSISMNAEFPEESLRKKFKASSAQQEATETKFEEKVQRIRPNLTFFGGFFDTSSVDTYSRSGQYHRNAFSSLLSGNGASSSGSSMQSSSFKQMNNGHDDASQGIAEFAYYTNLKLKNILVPDKYFKHPKIDFFMLPMLYQFIIHEINKSPNMPLPSKASVTKTSVVSSLEIQESKIEVTRVELSEEQRFRVQNMIFQLLLSDKQVQRKSRQRKELFKRTPVVEETFSSSNTQKRNRAGNSSSVKSKADEVSQVGSENDLEVQSQETDKQGMHSKYYNSRFKESMINDFKRFCASRFNFDLDQFISSIPETQRREKNLLFNTIMLGMGFARFLLSSQSSSTSSSSSSTTSAGSLSSAELSNGVEQQSVSTTDDTSCNQGKSKVLQPQETQQTVQDTVQEPLKQPIGSGTVGRRRGGGGGQSVSSNGSAYVSSKSHQSFSSYIDSVDNMDFFEVNMGEILSYYVKHFENFVGNHAEQLQDYLGLDAHARRKSVIGAVSSQAEIDAALQEYASYVSDPKTQNLRSYQYHDSNRKKWTEEEYRRFVTLYKKHMKNHVNNRPIALEMKNGIHANHVRYEKQVYMAGMRKRAEKNGITLEEQVQNDIDNFTMDFFVKKTNDLNGDSNGNDRDGQEESDLDEDDEDDDEEDDDEDDDDDDDDDDEEEEENDLDVINPDDSNAQIDEESENASDDDDDDQDDDNDEEEEEISVGERLSIDEEKESSQNQEEEEEVLDVEEVEEEGEAETGGGIQKQQSQQQLQVNRSSNSLSKRSIMLNGGVQESSRIDYSTDEMHHPSAQSCQS